MQFQTLVPIPLLKQKISYQSKIVSLGSCFAVNMAQKFTHFQFQNTVNPLGILFHPAALERLVTFAFEEKVFDTEDVFLHNEIWSCFDAHSDMNELEEDVIIDKLNTKIPSFRKDLETATHLIITLGTAWVYRNKTTGNIVANCHKVPQNDFTKELFSVGQIAGSLDKIHKMVTGLNPNIQLIFTISPVRHIKDGIVENQQSKAHLIAGLHQFLDQNREAYYFPSYEIVMDELRDYRFYAKDLIHPNEIAVDYIWEKFTEYCLVPESLAVMKLVDEVQKGLAHRPFNPYSEAHQQFLDKLAQKLDRLLDEYPFMNFR